MRSDFIDLCVTSGIYLVNNIQDFLSLITHSRILPTVGNNFEWLVFESRDFKIAQGSQQMYK